MIEKAHPWTHLVMVRGGGDLASGVILRLARAGFKLFFTEIPAPLSVRRTVCFSEAVYEKVWEVEGITAQLVETPKEAEGLWKHGKVPCFIDGEGKTKRFMKPDILIDAIMAKRNLGTSIEDAPLTIALGPGFEAGKDVHAVIETKRGHTLGRVILEGGAIPDTGEPEPVLGYTHERVLRANRDGTWKAIREIGDQVKEGDLVGEVEGMPLFAPISGTIRGLVRSGIRVTKGLKIGDIDPRGIRDYAYTVSDKALAVAGGVLEAIMMWCSNGHCLR